MLIGAAGTECAWAGYGILSQERYVMRLIRSSPRFVVVLSVVLPVAAVVSLAGLNAVVQADTPMTLAQYKADPAAMIDAYRHVEVASVSDAMEQILHEQRYMSHNMQAIFPAKFAGPAISVELVKDENHDPHALDGMLNAIDTGAAGSVYVMSIQDGANIAGMGGIMGHAMLSRDFQGAVIDGGVRDIPELKKIEFPVFALGAVPSTSVGHYRFKAANVPIMCDGVRVAPGDIITADQDGVAVVPRADAAEILVRAQQLDFTEHSMYAYIDKFHSIEAAVARFGRL
jgi:regulator of RNase E activity RraA